MAGGRTSISRMLAEARSRLTRLAPEDAHAAQREGALLIDVRTVEQRSQGGDVPGSVPISLNHLEWRLDPDEPGRLPYAGDLDRLVIVLCEEGYCSSLAAIRLQDLGYRRATDVAGGFVAWRRSGLPVGLDRGR